MVMLIVGIGCSDDRARVIQDHWSVTAEALKVLGIG